MGWMCHLLEGSSDSGMGAEWRHPGEMENSSKQTEIRNHQETQRRHDPALHEGAVVVFVKALKLL